jgi:hemolysin III
MGFLLGVAAISVLIVFASIYGTVWHIVSCSIYSFSLLFLYATSTLYHSFIHTKARAWLQKLDHAAIFIFIAGSYTPFTLVSLRDGIGWTLFGIVWGMCIVGVSLKMWLGDRYSFISIIVYLIMGWAIIFAFNDLVEILEGGATYLMAGGIIYSVGAIFYAIKKIPYNHPIWHLFVIGGTVCHYITIFYYVVPLHLINT